MRTRALDRLLSVASVSCALSCVGGPLSSGGNDSEADGPGPAPDAATDVIPDELQPPQGCDNGGEPIADSLRAKLPSKTPSGLSAVGVALSASALADPGQERYRQVAGQEFNFVTPENALKWGEVEAVRGTRTFADADRIVNFACQNQQAVRGHALVWHEQLPAWVPSLPADELRAALNEHIDAVVGRYRGQIRQWDVVNEAVTDDGTLRDSPFLQKLGPDYIAEAFRRARQADPDAKLGYNDYSIEASGTKSDAVYKLIQGLVAAGVPIDYVGFQTHMTAGYVIRGPVNETTLQRNIARYGELGLEVYITEMDLRSAGVEGQRDAVQRESFRSVVNGCRLASACRGVTFWGVHDASSYIHERFGPDEPLLFDDNFQRKPAYYGVLDGFAGVPAIPIGACTNPVPGSLWCDGAETNATWQQTTGGGTVFLSSDSFRGQGALLASVQNGGSNRQAMATRVLPSVITQGALHARAYVKVPSAANGGITAFGFNEANAPYQGMGFGIFNGQAQLSLTTANQFPVQGTIPIGQWMCVELALNVGNNGRAELRIDGNLRIALNNVDTLPPTGYSSANAGILYASPDSPQRQVLIDEVVVSQSPIGCLP